MANQVTVSNDHSINVTIEPPANVQVQVSRAVIGTIANVPSANTANTVTNNAQPNITSVGTLTSLTSNGNITAPFFIGNVVGNISGNITVPGNNTAVLFNQVGNAGASDALTFNYSSNVLTANGNIVANYFIGDGSQLTGIVTQQSNNANFANLANFANVATTANSVAGPNVTGIVANANYSTYSGIAGVANSVAVANVSGIGNIATVNLDGNASNILFGNGIFSTVPVVANVANANYANFAGTAFSVNASNIVGTVNLANFATTANSVAGANVSGVVANANYSVYSGTAGVANSVAVANVSGIGNIATVNLDGNVSNLLTGNGTFVAIPTVSANANYANFAGEAFSVSGANVTSEVANANYATYSGTVTTNAQPNITSVGTLTGLVVGGDITPNANITYSLGNNTNRFSNLYLAGNTIILGDQTISANATGITVSGNLSGDASGLSNISGANVVGDVSGADHANVADSANSVAGANVSGEVANASYATTAGTAYSVDVANVVGIGNIATINLDGNVNNLLAGDGTFVPIPTQSANANYANFAGDVVNNSQPNITSVGILTGINISGILEFVGNSNAEIQQDHSNGSTTITIYAGNHSSLLRLDGLADAKVEANANVIISANSQGTNPIWNFDNTGNLTLPSNTFAINYANGTQVPLDGPVANANYANFAGQVVDATQSNITSVGILTSLDVSGNATIGNITNVDSVTYDTANVPVTVSVAQTSWNDGDGTLDLGLKGGNVTLQVGQQQYARVHNNEANTLSKGEVVYVVGASGNRIAVSRAQANAEATSVGTLGFVAESITTGDEGFVITSGALYKLNTLGYTAGATVYLSPSTPGGWTTTKPVAPDQLVVLGWIERVSATVGSIYVKVDNGYELDELHNVLITTPVAGEALVYNSSNLWVNGNPNIANIAYSVSGANVSGAVDYATTANSVAVGNVSGIGNIATVNLDGSSVNVLYGNGVFAPVSGGSGGSSISNGTSNVNIATSGGNVTMGISGTADVYTFSNTRISTTAAFQSQNSTSTALPFSVIQGGSGANALIANSPHQLQQIWNNASANFTVFRTNATDTASGANSILFDAQRNSVSQFNINKSGNVNFTGIITGDGGGLSNIAAGNLSGNVNFANTAGTVTTNAQPNITSVGQLSGLYIASNAFQMIQSGASTPGRFLVSQTPTGGLTSNLYYSQFNQTWNNASTTFTNFLVSVTDTASNANSRLFDAQTNSASKFSITKSGNVAFAGVITGDGGGLSNISATATSISNGTSNITIASSGGNAIVSVGGVANVLTVTTTGANVNGTITGNQLISNIATGTAPLVVTSTTQVANLNVATAGLATFATTANSVAVANVSGIGNISTINLNGNSSQVLYGNGIFAAVSGGSGTPGGANTELQFNNNGSFGGISTVTWNGSNISLGAVGNVKITGGVNNEVMRTDGTGNLSFSSIAQTLLVGTRTGPYTVPITNYTFQVTARTGNVTVYVN